MRFIGIGLCLSFVVVSCVGKGKSFSSDSVSYLDSMRLVGASVDGEGISRKELFRRFSISGVRSARSYVFDQSGRRTWERWELSGGYKLVALKYKYDGEYEVVQAPPLEKFPDATLSGGHTWVAYSSRERHLEEVPPEMYFDNVLLFDSNSFVVDRISIYEHTTREK